MDSSHRLSDMFKLRDLLATVAAGVDYFMRLPRLWAA